MRSHTPLVVVASQTGLEVQNLVEIVSRRGYPLSKANRKKGAAREKHRFICWCHEVAFQGPVRFKHMEAWKDWNIHNLRSHNHLPLLGWTGDWVHHDAQGAFVSGQEIVSLL